MKITKAVITAAARAQRALPLQTLVDRDGVTKSVLSVLIEEALECGHRRDLRGPLPRRRAGLPRGGGRPRRAAALRAAGRAARLRPRPRLRPRVHRGRAVPAHGRRPSLSQPGGRRAARPSLWRPPPARAAPCPACSPRARACCPTSARSAAGACRAGPALYEVETVLEKPTPDRGRDCPCSCPACARATTCVFSACTS